MSALGAFGLIASAVVAVASAGIYTLYLSAFALRAKQRAVMLLSHERLLASVKEAGRGRMDAEDLNKLIQEIESTLYKLSERDRKFVEEGLRQPDQAGAERYAKEILHRAQAV